MTHEILSLLSRYSASWWTGTHAYRLIDRARQARDRSRKGKVRSTQRVRVDDIRSSGNYRLKSSLYPSRAEFSDTKHGMFRIAIPRLIAFLQQIEDRNLFFFVRKSKSWILEGKEFLFPVKEFNPVKNLYISILFSF